MLTGGSSQFQGLKERLEREVQEMAPTLGGNALKVKLVVPSQAVERRYSAWIGGSILASLGSFQQMWMSQLEYQENGAALIHRKSP